MVLKTRKILTALLLGSALLTGPAALLSGCSGNKDPQAQVVAPRTNLVKDIEKYWSVLQDTGTIPQSDIQEASECTLEYLKRLDDKMSEAAEFEDMEHAYPTAVALLQSDISLKSAALYQYLISNLQQNGDTVMLNPMTLAFQNIVEQASDIQRRVHSQYAETLADAIDDFNNE